MGNYAWPTFGLKLAIAAATNSEDPYVKVGAAVLREDGSVASVGYNGGPAGVEIDWSNRDERRKRVIHAESNALRYLKPGEGHYMCSTLCPCSECVKLIASYGIKHVVYLDRYDKDQFAEQLAKEFGIQMYSTYDIGIDPNKPGTKKPKKNYES